MAKDLVSIAIGELGYTAGKNNYTKYGAWIGQPNCQWCQAFVTWCCYQAGVQSKVKKTASTTDGMNYFKSKNRFEYKESYFPARNDIIYFKSNGASHVGIVENATGDYNNGIIYTIEGNSSSKVCRRTYKPNDKTITGYGLLDVNKWDAPNSIPTTYDDSLDAPKDFKVSSPSDNTIKASWSKYSEVTKLNRFNLIIDGVTYFSEVKAGTYTVNQITAGKHTVYLEVLNGTKVKRLSQSITVKGKNLYPTGNSSGSTSANNSTKSSKKGSSSQSGKEELKYLKQFLKTIEKKNAEAKKQPSLNYEISKINYHHEVKINLTVQNGKKLFSPPVIEGLKVVWERKNTVGKLSFQTILSSKYKIKEGNSVLMTLNGKKFFYGFVFTVKHGKDKKLDVTVYDQLRYLKNKDTYVYKKKTTDALIRMIAKDMGLNVGTLAKTKCAVTRAEDNLTLFDIISNSLNETLMATGNTYTLYDDCGKLMLKKPTGMKVTSCLIDAETAEDYSYSRSIDQDVYNQIKLEYQSDDGKKVKFYYTRSKKNISKWGTLQYFEKIDYPKLAKIKGEVLLKLYNRVSKTINISGAFGNAKVRAGSLIPVLLNLGDDKVSSFLLVDKVTHMFDNGVHKMDLDLSGGGFDSSQ